MILIKGTLNEKAIIEMIHTTDVAQEEEEYIKHKLSETYILINREAWNAFTNSLSNGILKYLVRFNYYNTCDNIINKKEKIEICPRDIVTKSWDYIIFTNK